MTHRPRPVLGLFAGIAAGLVASAAMAAFQSQARRLLPDGGGDGESATATAADAVSTAVIADPAPDPHRTQADQAVHYVVGGVLGALYGVLTEYRPDASAGFGSAYGIATAALLDEGAVPAAGLGHAPQDDSLATRAYGAGAHLVYGFVLEGVRGLIAGRD